MRFTRPVPSSPFLRAQFPSATETDIPCLKHGNDAPFCKVESVPYSKWNRFQNRVLIASPHEEPTAQPRPSPGPAPQHTLLRDGNQLCAVMTNQEFDWAGSSLARVRTWGLRRGPVRLCRVLERLPPNYFRGVEWSFHAASPAMLSSTCILADRELPLWTHSNLNCPLSKAPSK